MKHGDKNLNLDIAPDTIGIMQERKHYSKAPITEAVIDLRVNLLDEGTLAALADVYSSIKSDYPNQEALLILQGQMTVGASVGATASQTPVGFGYSSPEQKQIVQTRIDGFSFNRLAPYEQWEPFRDEAKRLWEIYQSAVAPTSVTRIALRYINRLDIPLPVADLKDYLRTFPEISPDLPQSLSGYFMQLQIPQPEVNATLLLNQAIIPPSAPDTISVLLDIDLFQDCHLPGNESSFWNLLEKMHEKIDQIFEACITDHTRELIN